jgi:hypothetical protein
MNTVHPSVTGRKASTIDEFCEEHRISRGLFYVLRKKGLAPRVTKLGSKQIITIEDAAAWRKAISEAA